MEWKHSGYVRLHADCMNTAVVQTVANRLDDKLEIMGDAYWKYEWYQPIDGKRSKHTEYLVMPESAKTYNLVAYRYLPLDATEAEIRKAKDDICTELWGRLRDYKAPDSIEVLECTDITGKRYYKLNQHEVIYQQS